MKKVTLGKEYEDKIHGLRGVAYSRTDYMTGCSRVCLRHVVNGELKYTDFDEPELKGIRAPKADPGGPPCGPTHS